MIDDAEALLLLANSVREFRLVPCIETKRRHSFRWCFLQGWFILVRGSESMIASTR